MNEANYRNSFMAKEESRRIISDFVNWLESHIGESLELRSLSERYLEERHNGTSLKKGSRPLGKGALRSL